MVENIGSYLMTLCGSSQSPIKLFLSEAKSEDYPYAVYEADYTPHYDKDGVYKIVGDVTVRAYSKDASEAETLAASIDTLILANFASGGYTVRQMSQLKKDCVQDVWSVAYTYRITQYRITTSS
jgi:hypothetical protein